MALGAALDTDATPGLDEGGDEFYSVEGAVRLREKIAALGSGRALVGVTGPPRAGKSTLVDRLTTGPPRG